MHPSVSLPRVLFNTPRRVFTHSQSTHAYAVSPKSRDDVSVGDVVRNVVCTDLSSSGEGVCKTDQGSFVIFVPGALPGEILDAKISSIKSGSYAKARKVASHRPHDFAVKPECKYFNKGCGGCTLQSLEYSSQIDHKYTRVKNLMQRVAKLPDVDAVMAPLVATPPLWQYHYRNKVEFSMDISTKKLGLHYPGSSDRLLPISSCSLQTEGANVIYDGIQHLVDTAKISRILYDVVIRHSVAHDTYLINFITSKDAQEVLSPRVQRLVEKATGRGLHISGCINTVGAKVNSINKKNKKMINTIVKEEYVLHGQPYLVERLGKISYRISPNSFFQVNTRQAERLVDMVVEAAALNSNDTCLDLYCGCGTLTLPLAQQCKFAYGVELSASSIRDAKENAVYNKITNVDFTCCDAGNLNRKQLDCDVVVVDPARNGLTPAVIASLRSSKARRIVYVSCNPATQARDFIALCSNIEVIDNNSNDTGTDSKKEAQGSKPFVVKRVQPIDLYPQTQHIETVAVLER